jgi:hypothetical protein
MEYDPSNEEHKQILQYLIEEGAAFFEGFDDDGEPTYVFDMEVLEEVMPELHQAMQDDMDSILLDLYQRELIEVTYDEELNAHMNISEEGKRILIEEGFDLSGGSEE